MRSFIATENYSHLAAPLAPSATFSTMWPWFTGIIASKLSSIGPKGSSAAGSKSINVGQEQVPPGKTWYWAGVNQPGKDMLSDFVGRDDGGGLDDDPGDFRQPKVQAAVQVEHGLGKRTSIGLLATALLAGNEKLTFVEGSVRRSIGPALVEAAVARDGKGGMACVRRLLPASVRSVSAPTRSWLTISSSTESARSSIAMPACRSTRH